MNGYFMPQFNSDDIDHVDATPYATDNFDDLSAHEQRIHRREQCYRVVATYADRWSVHNDYLDIIDIDERIAASNYS